MMNRRADPADLLNLLARSAAVLAVSRKDHLREALGDGVIVTSGDEAIAIDPEALTCDVTRMVSAFAAGRWEETVERYRGELLAGMHVAASGEVFEDWLARERARVTEMVMRALDALGEQCEPLGLRRQRPKLAPIGPTDGLRPQKTHLDHRANVRRAPSLGNKHSRDASRLSCALPTFIDEDIMVRAQQRVPIAALITMTVFSHNLGTSDKSRRTVCGSCLQWQRVF